MVVAAPNECPSMGDVVEVEPVFQLSQFTPSKPLELAPIFPFLRSLFIYFSSRDPDIYFVEP